MIRRPALLLLLLLAACVTRSDSPHPGFVYLDQVLHTATYDARYHNGNNFVGQRIDGYRSGRIILSQQAATALAAAEQELEGKDLHLKIFDGYRPRRAVEHFRRWASDPTDTRMKSHFYPDLDKSALFGKGYIARNSGHSRGSTVDLTLIDATTGQELDMGSPFDFFGPISHHDTPLISPAQARNREMLKSAMERHGFEAYSAEWWHYTLRNEPWPDTYFDFPVE
ncbi:M15 family metallopeptidase [Pseudomonas schmalbachii]|uniref:D-alanyl-D-alanine dipeptidase n=1 Tax=Pseudomonas schmalbachii TaxID=2816993 RepID=A0ABS3TRH2_9PSED|nr:M15 family metallopeptidase [Pseudomonas schmalbachii]MBO3275174.1 M15 family metallopeptidase [Pseudomonas schmalbachii]